ncbi:MAG: ribonuclease HI [Gammaproteobacteria bacterium]|jgi:ribonuclease HI|nr:ribonuclease HI [Gammaproteobacteria bacterium]
MMQDKNNTSVIVYTDGACRGNPGPGGWGVSMKYNGHHKKLYGAESETTNNRMELTAAIKALESLTRSCHVVLYTDSKYVLQGITSWMPDWKKRGWKTAAKKPVKNVDLWQRLDAATQKHEIEWICVIVESFNEGNDLADALANQAIDEIRAEL